jgi:hypothetical protein
MRERGRPRPARDYAACTRSPVDLPPNETATQLLRLLDGKSKQYVRGDPRAQVAVLLAVGQAVDRNAVTVAYACEVVAGRATDSTCAANFVRRARPELIKRLDAFPAAEFASAREFLTTAWQSPRALALAPSEPSAISSAPVVYDWVPTPPVDSEPPLLSEPRSPSVSNDEHCAQPLIDTELLRALMHALGEIDGRNAAIHPLKMASIRGHLWTVRHDLALLARACYISLQLGVSKDTKLLTISGKAN